jgi:glycosyltransferase involved in cell wall biosynthesis
MTQDKKYIQHAVQPLPSGVRQTLFSVMIPTYNCANYLRETLTSVLRQDPGPEAMQIEVVDDCSSDRPERVVEELGRGRVSFHRKERNEGSYACFNTCLDRSQGELVHILHGDDYVLPGFYDTIKRMAKRKPKLALYATRVMFVEEGRSSYKGARCFEFEWPTRDASPLYYNNFFQFAGCVFRRSTAEACGGFISNLVHAADWEFWARLITYRGVLMSSRALASYRLFDEAASSKQKLAARNLEGIDEVYGIFCRRYPDFSPVQALYTSIERGRRQSDRFRAKGMDEAAEASRAYCARKLSNPDAVWTLLQALAKREKGCAPSGGGLRRAIHALRKKMIIAFGGLLNRE